MIGEVLAIDSPREMESIALKIFRYQAQSNTVYRNYLEALKIAPDNVNSLEKIPFLPIEFFKTHKVQTGSFSPAFTFTSSGTTGAAVSRHPVKDVSVYEQTFTEAFTLRYGDPKKYHIMALLPSYLEREGSSLIVMAQKLIEISGRRNSGFFLYDHQLLAKKLSENDASGETSLLLGVTFALLDFAEHCPMALHHAIVMETGGMKGRKEEITRAEVASVLTKAFQLDHIHSEYGMTELMSQAYSSGGGIFDCPPWMKIMIRDTSDPLACSFTGSGAFNIIDLANIDSCAFIATQDLGKVYPDGRFEIAGRLDHSDIRGCNLLVI